MNAILCDDLIEQILSFLTVKCLTRFKCVSKSWKTIISSPIFIKLHLKQSSTNRYVTLIHDENIMALVRFPLTRLIENRPVTFVKDPYHYRPFYEFVGSCNGLICLYCYLHNKVSLYLWNPATKTLSNKIKFPSFKFRPGMIFNDMIKKQLLERRWLFCFGHHESTDSYKIVAINQELKEVKVFKVGDDGWRNIQSFPAIIIDEHKQSTRVNINRGVYVSDTVNWLAIRDWIKRNQFLIISLDLGTERYSEFILPSEFYEVNYIEPGVCRLMDSLCFSHDFEMTHFVIWQMMEFGVEESWTQLFKINYLSLIPDNYDHSGFTFLTTLVLPISLSEDGNTLILAWEDYTAFIYSLRDDRGEETRISNEIQWFCAKEYVESLVSTN